MCTVFKAAVRQFPCRPVLVVDPFTSCSLAVASRRGMTATSAVTLDGPAIRMAAGWAAEWYIPCGGICL
jgi:hypothetical protein